jgi:hypothetical protein
MRDTFRATGEKILASLLQRFNEQQQKFVSEEKLRLEAVLEKERRLEAAKEKALKEANATAEAKKAALEKIAIEQEGLRQIAATEEHKNKILEQLKKLKVGGGVSFYIGSNNENCKLAAVIQSTGLYVFVNRSGVKACALSKQELIEKLIDGTAKIFDFGSNFDSTLEQVVNNLRQRKK